MYTKLVNAARNSSWPTPKKRTQPIERSDGYYSPHKRVSTTGVSSPRRVRPKNESPKRNRDEEDELIGEHDLLNDTALEMETEE
jgi:hypothetical protein